MIEKISKPILILTEIYKIDKLLVILFRKGKEKIYELYTGFMSEY